MRRSREQKRSPRKRSRPGPARHPLAEVIVAFFAELFREDEIRKKIRRRTGATDAEIECALRDSDVSGKLREIERAWVQERWPQLLRRLFAAAERGEAWAWRVLLDNTDLGERLRAASAPAPADDPEAFISTGYEQRLLRDLRSHASPQRTGHAPPAEGPPPSG
jgi:hypothetical protein